MKDKLRIFQWLNKKFDLSCFYSITIDSYNIDLQGHYSAFLISELKKLNIEMKPKNGFIEGRHKYIRITLTGK